MQQTRKSNNGDGKSTKRSFHSKVATGCVVCKSRHVKCDETRPICARCIRANRAGDCRYVQRKVWLFQSSWEVAARSASIANSLTYDYGDEHESWNINYFREKVIPSISQWSFATGANAFWGDSVLWYAQFVPVVRRLAVGLSSRHRDTLSFCTEQEAYASSQYTLALRDLNHTANAGADLLLICGFLMAVYEHFDPKAITSSGLVHHNAAHRILNDPATPWSWVTEAMFFHAQQMECVVSIFKHPVILPSANSRPLVLPEVFVLAEHFSTTDEMMGKFFEILRWRFVYAAFHQEWTSTCDGFTQVL
jgi:hypothetical protein